MTDYEKFPFWRGVASVGEIMAALSTLPLDAKVVFATDGFPTLKRRPAHEGERTQWYVASLSRSIGSKIVPAHSQNTLIYPEGYKDSDLPEVVCLYKKVPGRDDT